MSNARPPRPYVDPTSAAADAPVGPPPPPEPTPHWQQASARPRPREAARPRPAPRPAPTTGYATRHWRGELSLARSFWVNNLLLATPLALALTGLMSWISVTGDSLQISAIAVLTILPLLMGLDVWCIVGAWRSATNYLQEQGSLLWGWLARIVLILGALQLAVSILFGLLPRLDEYVSMARGIDPLGQAKFVISPDGRSLKLEGVIGMGDGERLRTLLASDAARGLKRVELSSPGGRVREAERMADALKQRQQASRAVGTCASACTLVFLAGQPRQLAPEGQLGFHRASTGTYNPVFDELANQRLAKSYRNLGLPERLIDKTLDTPSHDMWFVPRADLLAYSLIAASPQTLAVPLPSADPGTTQADFDDALRQHPVWDAVERRYAGTVERAAQRMWEARAAGAGDEIVQLAALAPLAKQMPDLLNGTDPQTRRRYLQLVADQLKALRAPTCRALLDGQLAVRAALPVELQAREAQWILEAANGAPPRWLPKPPNAIEVEVLDRTVGRAALGMLSQLWADPRDAQPPAAGNCDGALGLLNRLAAQPVARRQLAERLLFHPRP